LNIASL
jgi:hypothetical protein